MNPPSVRIGVDTGGTFTDVLCLRDGEVSTWKLPSTPPGYERAVLEGAVKLAAGGSGQLIHSTTVATNALLERKGARCALVATRGFRDVLEIGRQARPELYALSPELPAPLVPRELRFELTERVGSDGEIIEPLAMGELPDLIQKLRAAEVESVAVVFLFSFLRPEHERRLGERLRAEGFEVSLSHEVLPEFREYERSSTTAANAYVRPAMRRYLSKLESLAGAERLTHLQIVQSNGGTLPPGAAADGAVNSLLSGPAAGLRGALRVAVAGDPEAGRNLITFDMGGTSTDVSLMEGAPRLSSEMKLGGFPIGVPMVDVHTVGAGGGSIASVDEGGALRVGPESAGADPGPACYGRGGRPTVTDAHVVLGHLRPEHFLQGRMTLRVDRAREALEQLGRDMGGLSAKEAARGVLRLVNTRMENAIRVISVQRGFSPRDFRLVGFGGAGGLHVFALAGALEMDRVLVPAHPGVLSALGAATAPLRREAGRTVMRRWEVEDSARLESELGEMRKGLAENFRQDGFDASALEFRSSLDMRYVGQSHELSVPVERPAAAAESFHALHRQRFGHAEASAPVELVTLRMEAELPPPEIEFPGLPVRSAADPDPFVSDGIALRERLRRGDVLRGPALVLEDFHTVVLPAGWRLEPDRIGNLAGTREGGRHV